MTDVSNKLQTQLTAQKRAMGITEEQLEAISESRKQVNKRILNMSKLINSLQSKVSNLGVQVKQKPKASEALEQPLAPLKDESASTSPPS